MLNGAYDNEFLSGTGFEGYKTRVIMEMTWMAKMLVTSAFTISHIL